MAQHRRQSRKHDLDRIMRLFTADDVEFDRLVLIARLTIETRLDAAR